MKNFVFDIPTKIVFGRGAEQQAGKLAAQYGKRVLILYGSERIRRNGLLPAIEGLLNGQGMTVYTYGGIKENPLLSVAEDAARLAAAKDVDFLLAVGGGSIIDTAKAVSIGWGGLTAEERPAALWDYYMGKAIPDRALPIGVVLTMAATASEANCLSVITNEAFNKKVVFGHPLLYPKFALLNPELTYTVPPYQTVSGAMDVFSHAFERYFHLGQWGSLRRHLCTAVMRTVVEEVPKVLAAPENYDCRSQLMWAATMAHSDMIGAEGVFACHEMSHTLTEEFGIIHGAALAILMPAWCRYVSGVNPAPFAAFAADVWHVDTDGASAETAAETGIALFQQFIRDCGLPASLREAGVLEADYDMLAQKTMEGRQYLGESCLTLDIKDVEAVFMMAG